MFVFSQKHLERAANLRAINRYSTIFRDILPDSFNTMT